MPFLTKLTFNNCFDRLIGHEGGYVNDPNDPGGETKWGVSKRSYPHLDIPQLTREHAKEIYKKDFWDAVQAEKLPMAVTYQLFDFAVNSGPDTAIRYFQTSIGVAADGDFGAYSQRVAASKSESDLIMGILAARLDFMTRLKNWPNHGKGWARRIAQNLRYAVQDSD